jgi:hypothetical protein
MLPDWLPLPALVPAQEPSRQPTFDRLTQGVGQLNRQLYTRSTQLQSPLARAGSSAAAKRISRLKPEYHKGGGTEKTGLRPTLDPTRGPTAIPAFLG